MDEYTPGRTETDEARSGPPPSDQVRSINHILTSREVVELFVKDGLSRSQRRITKYCHRGDLDCFLDPDEQRYYITPQSVEQLIKHLKELQARHKGTEQIGPGPTTSDQGRPSPTWADQTPDPETEKQLKELGTRVFDLTVANKAKDYIIDHMREERSHFITKLEEHSRLIGQLETKLLQLEAPRQNPSRIIETEEAADPVDNFSLGVTSTRERGDIYPREG